MANLGEITKSLVELREVKAGLNEEIKQIDKKIEELKYEAIGLAESAGVTSTRVDNVATITVVNKRIPTVDDWEQFYGYIKENDYMHLLQRRVSSVAALEIIDTGEEVPGVKIFEKTDLNVRKL